MIQCVQDSGRRETAQGLGREADAQRDGAHPSHSGVEKWHLAGLTDKVGD